MRKVAAGMVAALRSGTNYKHTNTEVDWSFHTERLEAKVLLHGNCIARFTQPFDLILSDCGWKSRLTKDRLGDILQALRPECLPHISISQVCGEWQLEYCDFSICWVGTHHLKYDPDTNVFTIDGHQLPIPSAD
jgi:hypothetical protein